MLDRLVRTVFGVLGVALVVGCVLRPSPGRDSAAPGSTEPAEPAAEPSADGDGWIALFDGVSTSALRSYGGEEALQGWEVADGSLRTVPGAGVDTISRETFIDFELEFRWRVSPGGNSGVIYRVAETGDPSWATGPEYQILDNDEHPDGRDPLTSAASLYGLLPPDPSAAPRPVGEFNDGRIVVRDGQVEHWLNGVLAVRYQWAGPEVRQLIAGTKFRDLPGFMGQDQGHIVLQHHGEEVWLRDVRVRRLGSGD